VTRTVGVRGCRGGKGGVGGDAPATRAGSRDHAGHSSRCRRRRWRGRSSPPRARCSHARWDGRAYVYTVHGDDVGKIQI